MLFQRLQVKSNSSSAEQKVMVYKQCHKDERQIRAVNGKEPKLNFYELQEEAFCNLETKLYMFIEVTTYTLVSHQSYQCICFKDGNTLFSCSVRSLTETAASILICLVLIFFWAFHCWDFLLNWFREVLLEKCKGCFSDCI